MAQLNSLFTGTFLTRTLISSVALGLAFGCGVKREVLTSDTGGASNAGTGGATNTSGSGGASKSSGTGGTVDMDASALICPSATGHVTQLPAGTCSGTGSCNVIVDAQCGPGVNAIPATPPTFRCQCTSGNWDCTVIAGGFGLVPCDVDAGNPILGTGGASGTGSIDVCHIPDSAAASLQMGEACAPESCVPGGCFSAGSGSVRMCADGKVQTVTSTTMRPACSNCPITKPWSDCDAALTAGAGTGDACNWTGGGCSRTTDDPCCIEVIDSCASRGTIVRHRMCAPGCTNALPDKTLATVTDCASVPTVSDPCRPWSPCTGSFTCYGGLSLDAVPFSTSSDANAVGVIWCAGGNLVGGYAMGNYWVSP